MRIVAKSILCITLLSLFFFLAFFLYREFQLKTLIIITNRPKLNSLAILNRNNLLFINEKDVSDYLQKQNPEIKSIKFIKKFPQTIILQLEDRIPIAQIVNTAGNIYIDAEGIILTSENKYLSLPKIHIPNISILSDQKADWRAVKASLFIQEVTKQGIIIEQISADETSSVFNAVMSTGTQVLIPYDADMLMKASSLQVIVQRFKIVGKNITKVDFRFDKPLVTLSSGEKISSFLPNQ